MKFLCLIHLNEQEMDAMPVDDMNALNAEHLEFNEGFKRTGHFIEAEALAPASTAAHVRVREGKLARVIPAAPIIETCSRQPSQALRRSGNEERM